MNDKSIKSVLKYNLILAILAVSAQGLTLLQRSIYLFDMGMKKDVYGYLLFFAAGFMFLFQIIFGPWSDRGRNRKPKIIIFAAFMNLAGNFGFIITNNIVVLSAALMFSLIGFQAMFNMMRTLVASVSNKENTSTNLAAFQLVCAGAYATFSLAYGYIVELLGFNTLFVCSTVLTLLSSVVSVVLYAKVQSASIGAEDISEKISFVSSFKFAPQVIIAFGLYLFVAIAQYGTFNYILHYFKTVGGTDDILAGWILAIAAFVEAPAMYYMGRYFKKYNKEKSIVIFLLIGTLRWILFAFVKDPVWYFPIHTLRILPIGVLFIGISSLIMDYVPARRAGAAMGLLGSLSSIGNAVGPAVMGNLVERVSIQTGMLVMGAVIAIPTIVFAVIYKHCETKPVQDLK